MKKVFLFSHKNLSYAFEIEDLFAPQANEWSSNQDSRESKLLPCFPIFISHAFANVWKACWFQFQPKIKFKFNKYASHRQRLSYKTTALTIITSTLKSEATTKAHKINIMEIRNSCWDYDFLLGFFFLLHGHSIASDDTHYCGVVLCVCQICLQWIQFDTFWKGKMLKGNIHKHVEYGMLARFHWWTFEHVANSTFSFIFLRLLMIFNAYALCWQWHR